MKRVFWIVPERLAGRPGPTREPWSPRELREGGIDTVLNLSEHEPDPELSASGLRTHWVPLPPSLPADDALERALHTELPRAYALLQEELAAERRVLVHCVAGLDRTGTLLTCHVARSETLAPADALARVRRVRPRAITAEGWEPMALRAIARLLDDVR